MSLDDCLVISEETGVVGLDVRSVISEEVSVVTFDDGLVLPEGTLRCEPC